MSTSMLLSLMTIVLSTFLFFITIFLHISKRITPVIRTFWYGITICIILIGITLIITTYLKKEHEVPSLPTKHDTVQIQHKIRLEKK